MIRPQHTFPASPPDVPQAESLRPPPRPLSRWPNTTSMFLPTLCASAVLSSSLCLSHPPAPPHHSSITRRFCFILFWIFLLLGCPLPSNGKHGVESLVFEGIPPSLGAVGEQADPMAMQARTPLFHLLLHSNDKTLATKNTGRKYAKKQTHFFWRNRQLKYLLSTISKSFFNDYMLLL